MNIIKVRTTLITHISYMSTISFLLMLLQLPLPIFPSFLKLDLSDVPGLIATIIYGPLAGISTQFFKNILFFLVRGSSSGGIGEVANFFVGISFILPLSFIYKKKYTPTTFFTGAIVGIVTMSTIASLLNYFLLLPLYAFIMGFNVSDFINMGASINPYINNLKTFIILSILPFNILKGFLNATITYMLLKSIKPFIQKLGYKE